MTKHQCPMTKGFLFLLVIGHWSLVIGHWSLVIGHWDLGFGHCDFAQPGCNLSGKVPPSHQENSAAASASRKW
jgi:hypothetical protein